MGHTYFYKESQLSKHNLRVCFILYAPINNFSVMLEWVFLDWTGTKQQIKCLASLKIYDLPVYEISKTLKC